MLEIELKDLQRKENKEISLPGTKAHIEIKRRSNQVCVVGDENYFYIRNWLRGNKIPYDKILSRFGDKKEDVKEIKSETQDFKSTKEKILERKRENMKRAREIRMKKIAKKKEA